MSYVPGKTVVFADELDAVVDVILKGRNPQVDSCRLLDDSIPTSPVLGARLGPVGRFVLLGRRLKAERVHGGRDDLSISGLLLVRPLWGSSNAAAVMHIW